MTTARMPVVEQTQETDHRSDHIKRKRTNVIYFGAIADDSHFAIDLRIKIGWTKNFKQRQKEHEASKLGKKLFIEWLAVVGGEKNSESAIHQYFANVALPGEAEIFYPKEQIVNYIRWLRDQWFVWVPDDGEYNAPDPVDFLQWMPNDIHRKASPRDVMNGFNGPLNLPPRAFTADDFYTNPKILERARKVFGGIIDLDPASHAVANREVRARNFYSKEDDGLAKLWHGHVWVNPPFSDWKHWAPKIAAEWKSGRIREMCVLAATRTISALQFSPVHETATAVCFMRGRIRFWGDQAGPSPDDGHVVFYFGNNIPRFREHFSELGTIFENHP